MADQKISQLTALTGANTAADDLLAIVDTNAAETKKITREEFFKNIQTNVGIGTSSPSAKLQISQAYTSDTAVQFILSDTTGTSLSFGGTGGGVKWINSANTGAGGTPYPLTFQTGGTERMRIDSSGNVGIGTTSPNARITVKASGNAYTNGALALQANASGTSYLTNVNGTFFVSNDGTTDHLILTSSGNLGLGVTPSAWGTGSSVKAIQIPTGSLWNFNAAGTGGNIFLGNNYYWNGTNRIYTATGAASEYQQLNGQHAWYNAPSGTAGNAITFTQAMTLDASGNLGLGVTPSAWSLGKALEIGFLGNGVFSPSQGTTNLINNTYYSSSAYRYATTAPAAYYAVNTGEHQWYTAPSGTAGNAITFTERMRITSAGNVVIGTSVINANNRLNIQATGTTASGYSAASNSAFAVDFGTSPSGVINLVGNGSLGIAWTNSSAAYDGLIEYSSRNMRFVTANAERMRIDSSGNVQIGLTAPAYNTERLTVFKSGNTETAAFVNNAGSANYTVAVSNRATTGDNKFIVFATEGGDTTRGSITYDRAGGLVAYNTTSDYRAKDINGLLTDSGSVIDSVPVYMGKMKDATQERPMFIAHETPTYAHTGVKDDVDADGNPVYQQMDASALVPVMWAEIQSLRKRLAAAGL